jgi:hypothetical protein
VNAETNQGPTLLEGMRQRPLLVIAGALLLAGLVGSVQWFLAPAATNTGSLGLTPPPEASGTLVIAGPEATMARYTAQRAEFTTSDGVLELAAQALAGESPQSLRERLDVTASKTSNLVTINGQGRDGASATALVAAVMDAYRASVQEQVAGQSEAVAAALASAGDPASAALVRAQAAAYGDGVSFVVAPTSQTVEVRGLPVRGVLLGLLVGAGLGAFGAWWRADAAYRRAQAFGGRSVAGGPDRSSGPDQVLLPA